jgi:transcriptional regulator with XRE-family HTH domain
MNDKIDFRQQIKTLMTQKEISAAKLARKADLNSGTVYKYLDGTSEISAANLAKLFNVLNSIPLERKS